MIRSCALFVALSSVVLATEPSHAQTAADCASLMKHGIHDKSSHLNSEARYRQIQEFFRNNQFASVKDARDRAGKLGLDIEGILALKFNGKDSSTHFSEWKQELERSSLDVAVELGFSLAVEEKISDKLTELVEACIKQKGFHLYVIPSESADTFVIGMNYVPLSSERPATKGRLTVTPATVAKTCKPGKVLKTKVSIGPQGLSIACRRRKTQTVTISANTSDGTQTVIYDAYKIPNVAASFTVAPARITAGQSATLHWNATNARNVELAASTAPLEEVDDSGEKTVAPATTTEYRLVLTREDGKKVTKSVTVTVDPPPPHLVRADVHFRTTDDDKDHDTNVSTSIQCSGQSIASASDRYGKFDDNSDSGWKSLGIITPRLKRDISGQCQVFIVEGPNGHDEWHFDWKVRLTFSDNSASEYSGSGNVDHDRTTVVKPI